MEDIRLRDKNDFISALRSSFTIIVRSLASLQLATHALKQKVH
jgi:hypothetical protein